ncbi:unnamed protein product [Owenia fusiformis]|uniref:Uncharacterized protein n=1 Tax=Owenia fusiformis TaxID=6347 RepID=A0A8J1UG54_OWEFU|nr:unnamed protein product [Owenia fusiformis]
MFWRTRLLALESKADVISRTTKESNMYIPIIVVVFLAVVSAELCSYRENQYRINLDLSLTLKEKTWLLAVEGGMAPYSSLDQSTGHAVGFIYELVYEACTRCNMKCKTVFTGNDTKMCWDPIGPPPLESKGLFNNYYDGCIGWAPTPLRENVLAFSAPFLEAKKGRFYTRTSSNIKSLTDIVPGKKVGFRFGHYLDVFCGRTILENLDVELALEDTRNYISPEYTELLQHLKVDKKVDVAFLPEGLEGTEDLLVLGGVHNCTTSGLGIMHRKDVDFSWFGKCLAEVERVGRYKALCTHYNTTRCLDL